VNIYTEQRTSTIDEPETRNSKPETPFQLETFSRN
jgi:hypothetical protein